MPNYLLYRDDIETIEPDERETHDKIIEVMTKGQHLVREKYGHSVRISHAKAHGLLKGELIVRDDLPTELAQGVFAKPGTYPVIVRMSTAPGEITDDSKLSTVRGMAIKIFNVEGPKLPPFEGIKIQDWVLDTGKEFINSSAKTFLQAFKPNAEIAPKLPDTVKGTVSSVARGTNAALNAVGLNSEKLDFFGHKKNHPMAESYYSQLPFRYGDYVAKIGVTPRSAALKALMDQPFDPETPNALREATVAYFRTNAAEFDVMVQLNAGLEEMPIEDGMAKWSEDICQFQAVARLVLPVQNAFDPATESYVDEDLSFSPAHTLVAHRPLGSVNRARLAAYTALATLRRQGNGRPTEEPVSAEQVPA